MKKYTLIFILLLTTFAVKAQQTNVFKETTATTEDVATKYFTNYMALDWDKLEPLMHNDLTFQDPTGDLLFGENKPIGKEKVIKGFREGLASITFMTSKISRKYFSSSVGIFEMDLTFGFHNRQNGITEIKMPLVVVITVKDGKVIEHRDYGDYREYIKQLTAAQEKSKP